MNDSSKSYVFLHEMRFGIGFGIGFGMGSEWIRNSIQKEGLTGTEATIFGDIGIIIFVTGAAIGDVGLCILDPEQEMSFFFARSCLGKVRAEYLSVSEVSGQLHVQFGCKLSSKLSKERIKQDCKRVIRVRLETVHAWKKLLPGKSSWLETALAWKMSIPKWFPFAHGIKSWLD